MIVLGLTGGIASGKSYVAALLASRGAALLDADRHAREALDDAAVREGLVERWGAEIVDADGRLRRDAIAERVFAKGDQGTTERRFLESLIHPRVRERLRRELDAAERAGAPAAVLDVPLLHEAGWADACDAVIFVDTPLELRRRRAAERGWDGDELQRREAAQMPVEEKRRLADHIVSGRDSAEAEQAVTAVWGEIRPGPQASETPQ